MGQERGDRDGAWGRDQETTAQRRWGKGCLLPETPSSLGLRLVVLSKCQCPRDPSVVALRSGDPSERRHFGAAPLWPSVPRALSGRLSGSRGHEAACLQSLFVQRPRPPFPADKPAVRPTAAAVSLRSGRRGSGHRAEPTPPAPSRHSPPRGQRPAPQSLPNPSPSWLGETPGSPGAGVVGARGGKAPGPRVGARDSPRQGEVGAGAGGQERAEPQPSPEVSSFCLDAGGRRPPRPASRPPPALQHPGGVPGSPRPPRPTRAPLQGGGGKAPPGQTPSGHRDILEAREGALPRSSV